MTNPQSASLETVMVPMRDGIELATDIYLPSGDGPWPTLLERLPYGKNLMGARLFLDPDRAAQEGFAVVVQDCRGRFDSGGEWYPFHSDIEDGYDCVEWVAAQPWSTGRIGTFGGSGHGVTQWHAAMAAPPHLQAMAPITSTGDVGGDWLYSVGGAMSLPSILGWGLWVAGESARRLNIKDETLTAIDQHVTSANAGHDRALFAMNRPDFEQIFDEQLRNFMAEDAGYGLLRQCAPWFYDWVKHRDPQSPYWSAVRFGAAHAARLDVNSLHVAGWYDFFLRGTLHNYSLMTAAERLPNCNGGPPKEHYLIVGPWVHGAIYPDVTSAGSIDFGPEAGIDLEAIQLAFFKRSLGMNDSDVPLAPVNIFVMGRNQWRRESEWPPTGVTYTRLYLGSCNTEERGLLDLSRPSAVTDPDMFVFDPLNPVPTVGGAVQSLGVPAGAYDQSVVEQRDDVLLYTSPPLAADVEITGPVHAELWVSSSSGDTDFTAKLVDVRPDGRAVNLCDGIVRCSNGEGDLGSTELQPLAVHTLRVDLGGTSVVLFAGHRIRLEISSSNFPRFDVNPNNGSHLGDGMKVAAIKAEQSVYHDVLHPSNLRLPVLDSEVTFAVMRLS